jgi:hypothetical protein
MGAAANGPRWVNDFRPCVRGDSGGRSCRRGHSGTHPCPRGPGAPLPCPRGPGATHVCTYAWMSRYESATTGVRQSPSTPIGVRQSPSTATGVCPPWSTRWTRRCASMLGSSRPTSPALPPRESGMTSPYPGDRVMAAPTRRSVELRELVSLRDVPNRTEVFG